MSIKACLDVRYPAFHLQMDIECPSSGITAVFGPSGCGKTTLLRSVAGLDRFQTNEIHMNGVPWQDASHWTPPHRRNIGFIFQKPALFENRTVEDNLTYGWHRTPKAERKFDPEDIIKRLDLAEYLHRKTESLSGGEGQRVALGRALLGSPDFLLMDEPLSALDETTKQRVFPFLEQLRSFDIPVILVTHSLDEVARLADHVLLVENGHLVRSGSISDVLSDPGNGLATHEYAQCVLDGVVGTSTGSCSSIQTDAGLWNYPSLDLEQGSSVRLRIRARDVSLSRSRHLDTSIRNLLDATLIDLTPVSGHQYLLRLQVREAVLLSLVTRDAVEDLHLKPGENYTAQIKSISLGGPSPS